MNAAPAPGPYLQTPPDLHPDMELVSRVVPMPEDLNSAGDVFGGWIMAHVDLAGSVLPTLVAKGRIATVAVNEFEFKQAVAVGDVLSIYARVERIGTTSIKVHVVVYAQAYQQMGDIKKVTEARLTYVALDEHGRPRPVPR